MAALSELVHAIEGHVHAYAAKSHRLLSFHAHDAEIAALLFERQPRFRQLDQAQLLKGSESFEKRFPTSPVDPGDRLSGAGV